MEINLPINFYSPGRSGHVVAELAWTVVVFVLYMRGVIPLPYEQCAAIVQTVDEGKGVCARDRKMMRLLGELRKLQEAVWACETVATFNNFTILLGPSSNSPLERYTVEFIGAEPDANHAEAVVSEKQVNLAKRRVVQKLIEVQAEGHASALSRTNVFLAINISREAGEKLEGSEEASKALDCFAFRDSFRWETDASQQSKKRCGRRDVRLRLVSQGVESRRAASPSPIDGAHDGSLAADGTELATEQADVLPGRVEDPLVASIWLVSRRGIKGLPPG